MITITVPTQYVPHLKAYLDGYADAAWVAKGPEFSVHPYRCINQDDYNAYAAGQAGYTADAWRMEHVG